MRREVPMSVRQKSARSGRIEALIVGDDTHIASRLIATPQCHALY